MIKRLTRNEKSEAVKVLSSSFYNYPVMRYVLKESGELYKSHLEYLVGTFCEIRLTQNWPLLGYIQDSKVCAVAGINEPGEMPHKGKFDKAFERLKTEIGSAAYKRLDNFEKACSHLEPTDPHFFLGIIGVDPAYQKKGFAKKLIEELKSMSLDHPLSKGVALSTESTSNVPYYELHGFGVIGEADVEDLHTWLMFWKNS